jgi:cytochrome d ubiquinol oxidase subunit I
MQNPVGSDFNPITMRMEMQSFADVILNPVAQVKFIHTVAAGYVTGSMFVLGISAYYILKGRDLGFARRSFAIAAGFGLASILSVIVLGDESGYEVGDVQKTKLAAIEAEWETEPAPAAFTLIGFPDQEAEETHGAIKIPYVMGIIATRSFDEEVPGLKELMKEHERRIRNGMIAYRLLEKVRSGNATLFEKESFENAKEDLGYGLLLKRYTDDIPNATEDMIRQATKDSIPQVAPLFWTFRIMVALGFAMLFIFAASFYFTAKRTVHKQKWLLKAALYGIPMPWIAVEMGWFVAEYGRQPWAIGEVLPTYMAASSLTVGQLWFSMIGFLGFYTMLLIIEMYLMFKFARLGPSSLHTGRYSLEQGNAGGGEAVMARPVESGRT